MITWTSLYRLNNLFIYFVWLLTPRSYNSSFFWLLLLSLLFLEYCVYLIAFYYSFSRLKSQSYARTNHMIWLLALPLIDLVYNHNILWSSPAMEFGNVTGNLTSLQRITKLSDKLCFGRPTTLDKYFMKHLLWQTIENASVMWKTHLKQIGKLFQERTWVLPELLLANREQHSVI